MRALSEITVRDSGLFRSVAERFVSHRLTSHWQLARDGKLVLRWHLDEPEEKRRSRSPRG